MKMKKITALAVLAAAAASLFGCSGPADSASSSAKASSAASSVKDGSAAEANVSAASGKEKEDNDKRNNKKEEEKVLPEDVTQGGKYDNIVVNEGVERAVKANSPQAAAVNGYYSFTYSDFGKVYSNEELEKCFDRLQDICSNAGFSMSFSYRNIETGAYVGYNQYSRFMTCSTIKAPYIKSILQQGIDLDTVISRDYIWPGDTGTVVDAPFGTKYTARELIEYSILESDNTAYYLLFNTFGYQSFNSLLYSLGANYSLGDSWIFTYCTSDDMMKCYEDIYKFGESSENGKWLVELMSDTDVNIQIGKALGAKYKVAQKYGSEFNEWVFNDCAVVYADSPFVLCIFTQQYPETEESCQVFRELSLVFDDINTLLA